MRRYLTMSEVFFIFLTCGAGGVLFVVFYFLMGPEERADAQWMLWSGIAWALCPVVVLCALVVYRSKSAARTEMLEQRGVLALAEITAMAETNVTINDNPVLKLDLHISGSNLTPFDTQQRVQVSLLRQPIITARKLVVLVDPTDNSYQIDWQRSILISGAAPFQLTSSEDHQTYDLTGQVGPIMEYFQVLKAHGIAYTPGKVDLRANPDVRRQVLAIARNAQASQQKPATQAPAATMPASVPAPSAAQRMQNLETLRAAGTISETEYTAKRQEIISTL